jgi:hypothetical protein
LILSTECDVEILQGKGFRSKTYITLTGEDTEDNLNAAFQEVHRALEEFIRQGSNWTVHKVICLEISLVSPMKQDN